MSFARRSDHPTQPTTKRQINQRGTKSGKKRKLTHSSSESESEVDDAHSSTPAAAATESTKQSKNRLKSIQTTNQRPVTRARSTSSSTPSSSSSSTTTPMELDEDEDSETRVDESSTTAVTVSEEEEKEWQPPTKKRKLQSTSTTNDTINKNRPKESTNDKPLVPIKKKSRLIRPVTANDSSSSDDDDETKEIDMTTTNHTTLTSSTRSNASHSSPTKSPAELATQLQRWKPFTRKRHAPSTPPLTKIEPSNSNPMNAFYTASRSSISSRPKLNPFIQGEYVPWMRSPTKQSLKKQQPPIVLIDDSGHISISRSDGKSKRIQLGAPIEVIEVDDGVAIIETGKKREVDIDLTDENDVEIEGLKPSHPSNLFHDEEVKSMEIDNAASSSIDVITKSPFSPPRAHRKHRSRRIIEETEENQEVEETTDSTFDLEGVMESQLDDDLKVHNEADGDEEEKKETNEEDEGNEDETEAVPHVLSDSQPIGSTSSSSSSSEGGSNQLHRHDYHFPWLNIQSNEPPPPFKLLADNEDTEATKALSGAFKYPLDGCGCKGSCIAGKCPCTKKGSPAYAYVNGRVQFPATEGINIFECNSRCNCSSACGNRVVQKFKGWNHEFPFYVCKTPLMKSVTLRPEQRIIIVLCCPMEDDRQSILSRYVLLCLSWGVKCSKPIPAGTFIGDYTGKRLTKDEACGEEDEPELNDEYMFAINTCSLYREDFPELKRLTPLIQQAFKLSSEDCKSPEEVLAAWPRLTIDAIESGNLCAPNATSVQVFLEDRTPNMAHICYFARVDIPAHTDILVSYHYELNPRANGDWPFLCHCNTPECRHPKFAATRTAEIYNDSSEASETESVRSTNQSKSTTTKTPTPAPKPKLKSQSKPSKSKSSTNASLIDKPSPSNLFITEVNHEEINTAFVQKYIMENSITTSYQFNEQRRLILMAAAIVAGCNLVENDLIGMIKAACSKKAQEKKQKQEASTANAVPLTSSETEGYY